MLGQPGELYSCSHSLRAGFVTEARAHHTPDPLIARHTRHKDLRMLGVYDRPTDLFQDGVGLATEQIWSLPRQQVTLDAVGAVGVLDAAVRRRR